MKKLSRMLGGLIFVAIGIVIIVIGIREKKENERFYARAKEVTAYIDDINVTTKTTGSGKKRRTKTEHDVFVTYTVDGTQYKHIEIGEYSSSMHVGGTINLHYDPSNPKDVRYKEVSGNAPIFAIAFGAVFAGIGLIITLCMAGFSPNTKLKKTGIRCVSNDVYIDKNVNVKVNGRHPYVVYCRVQDPTGEYRECKSKNVYEKLDMYDIRSVDIYFDSKNPKKYYVDVQEAIKNSDKFY